MRVENWRDSHNHHFGRHVAGADVGAGTAAGLQAVGLSTTSVPAGSASQTDTNAQLAALNAEATHALEAALAGRASTLSADAAAGLLAAQQVRRPQTTALAVEVKRVGAALPENATMP